MANYYQTAKGVKLAKAILGEAIGKKKAAKLLGVVRFVNSRVLPEWCVPYIPASGWAGFCCPEENGRYAIYINPEHHQNCDDVAFTVGHEFAHVMQDIKEGRMIHRGIIFKTMRDVYSAKLGFKKGAF